MFCYPCRQYSTSNIVDRDLTYTEIGYRSWKHALDKGKGYQKHQESRNHIWCVTKLEIASSQKKTISEKLHTEILRKRRQYVTAMIEIVRFLAANELSFRGDRKEDREDGLFNRFFEFFVMKNPELEACHAIMPQNAKYSSPEFQNEVIDMLATEVRKRISSDVAAASFFTLLEDGTKSKNGDECICIALRFVKEGKVEETVLDIIHSKELHATAITTATMDALRSNNIDSDKMLSQCYDGAAVMSGHLTGVQTQIQQLLKRPVPYIHCYNHRLQLVVIKSLDRIVLCKHFFEHVKVVYDFFQQNNIKNMYDGHAITSLIVTRWSGHHRAAQSIAQNYAEIIDAIQKVQSCNNADVTGEQKVMAFGILKTISGKTFRFMLIFMNSLLGMIKPIDKMLQARSASLHDAMKLIASVSRSIRNLRDDEHYLEIDSKANGLTNNVQTVDRPQRTTKGSSRMFSEYILTGTTGESAPTEVTIKSAFYDTIDNICQELHIRFENNDDIYMAVNSAWEMDLEKLKPLEKLRLEMPSESEMSVAAEYIREKKSGGDEIDMLNELYKMRAAFPATYKLFTAIESFACSTSVCESSFSTLTRIGWGNRLSMTNHRLRQLTFLAFEKDRLNKLPDNELLVAFDKSKTRRVQLF